MRTIVMTLMLFTILTAVAETRMYQWTSPDSGNVQLSGTPPAWYRSLNPGPRVLVFEHGDLIDDTAVEVADAERTALRERAFGDDLARAAEPRAEDDAASLKSALAKARDNGVDIKAAASEVEEELAAAEQPAASDEIADKVSALKALIELWDQQQIDQARALIEQLPDDDADPARY